MLCCCVLLARDMNGSKVIEGVHCTLTSTPNTWPLESHRNFSMSWNWNGLGTLYESRALLVNPQVLCTYLQQAHFGLEHDFGVSMCLIFGGHTQLGLEGRWFWGICTGDSDRNSWSEAKGGGTMFVGTVYRKKVSWFGNHTATTCKDEGHGRYWNWGVKMNQAQPPTSEYQSYIYLI